LIIRDMFKKNIDREIKGVIKVAQTDEATRYQELDEYVVTRELLKHLSSFYYYYQKSLDGLTDEIGVWISGFFGSGKSHFLKILSYLLDNETTQGKKAVEFFDVKVPDPALYADIQRAGRIDCETILFNIDSKSPLGIKADKQAILKVFIKVFYDHLGYYGDDFKVAELEKYLNREGALQKFQENFERIKGEAWLERRNCFAFDEDAIVEALMETIGMSEQSARNWFSQGNGIDISIDQFAREVKEYIDTKGKDFHLIFLVDEIGQYIGDNTDLMLNLQTVVEDLGTHCHGQAWVIVTSQEDIDSVIKVKGNDFSKIQGRFKTRLSLSASSVDEVVKKRLLEKKDFADDTLRLLYNANAAALRNLIHFSDGTVADLKGYSSETEFSEAYPFVPYQFKLLQEVFNQIRIHGASGKHLSEGERSMLSAFQDAAKRLADEEPGVLVPFYFFYDSVHEFLDGSIQRAIVRASESADKGQGLVSFDVNVLKLLFLIRYIGDITPNIDNITTLMVTNINEDKLNLKALIQQSLARLISQNYVQKNADEYRFLTDEEQDINREIRNTVVDANLVVEALGKYIFNDIYDDQKYKYSPRYPFPYNSKIDETTIGHQTARIGLRILTKASDDYDADEAYLKMASANNNDLIIRLDENSDYFEEMHEALKIERFDKTKKADSRPASFKKIIAEKQEEAIQRKKRSKDMLIDALCRGRYYANAERLDVKGSGAKERINFGLKALVESTYQKLPYITEFLDSDADIQQILQSGVTQYTLDGQTSDPNHLASQEVMAYIDLQEAKHLPTSMKNVLDKFEDAPYGWREIDIAGLIAGLLKKQKIRLLYQGSYIDTTDKNLIGYLRKKTEVDKLLILKRVEIDPGLLQTVRSLSKELFNVIDLPPDEDNLIKRFLEEMQKKSLQLKNDYLSQYKQAKYPGKNTIEQGLSLFKAIEQSKNDHLTLLAKLKECQEDLLDWDEDIKRVEGFFNHQRPIFDKGLAMMERIVNNQDYLQERDYLVKTSELQNILDDTCPYGNIIKIPELVDWLEKRLDELLKEKRNSGKREVKRYHDELVNAVDSGLNQEAKDKYLIKIEQWFTSKYQYIDESDSFVHIDAAITQSKNFANKVLGEIAEAAELVPPVPPGGDFKPTPPVFPEGNVKPTVILGFEQIAFVNQIETEEDVDKYIAQLTKKLKALVNENKTIIFR
jgi:hypothetical protein